MKLFEWITIMEEEFMIVFRTTEKEISVFVIVQIILIIPLKIGL